MAKHSASEFDVGSLHVKVVKVFGMSLDQVIEKLEAGEDSQFAVDPRLISAVCKFLNDNKVFSIAEDEVEESDLAKKIAAIRNSSPAIKLVQEG